MLSPTRRGGVPADVSPSRSHEERAMSQLIGPVVDLFRFNSELAAIALADLAPEDAVYRVKQGEGSSIAYLVGHLCSSRYGLLKVLGAADANPYKELYGEGAGARDGDAYPPLTAIAAGWKDTAEKLHAALERLTDEDAMKPDDSGFPTPEKSLRGRLAFIAWHESYHIGQIGILRTERGYPSLRKALYQARQQG